MFIGTSYGAFVSCGDEEKKLTLSKLVTILQQARRTISADTLRSNKTMEPSLTSSERSTQVDKKTKLRISERVTYAAEIKLNFQPKYIHVEVIKKTDPKKFVDKTLIPNKVVIPIRLKSNPEQQNIYFPFRGTSNR